MRFIVNEFLNFLKMNFIIGNRIALRAFAESDITERHVAWLNDPVVMQFSRHRNLVHTKATCRMYLKSFDNSRDSYYVLIDRLTDLSIGSMTAYFNENHSAADLGILIGDTNFWGKGYAKEAILTLAFHLVRCKSVKRITCGTRADNERMIRLAESCGFLRCADDLINGETFLYFERHFS